jgi:hypothetical protein
MLYHSAGISEEGCSLSFFRTVTERDSTCMFDDQDMDSRARCPFRGISNAMALEQFTAMEEWRIGSGRERACADLTTRICGPTLIETSVSIVGEKWGYSISTPSAHI